jgi:nitrogenase molybdenum-iron protein alpha/beta subunit
MGSEDAVVTTTGGFIEKNAPDIIGILTSGLSEVKGDDIRSAVVSLQSAAGSRGKETTVVHVATPDYDGGLETGYARAVEAIIQSIVAKPVDSRQSKTGTGSHSTIDRPPITADRIINILAGSHMTPADAQELREIVEAFGMKAIVLPDLSALDGSRQGISPLSSGGTRVEEITAMGGSAVTLAIGKSLEPAAKILKEKAGVDYRVFGGLSGLDDTDAFMEMLSQVSGKPVPEKYVRRRSMLVDGMRDAHFFYGAKRACLALEPDHAVQMSRWLAEMGAKVELAMIPTLSEAADMIEAQRIEIGDLFSVRGDFDVLISNSHARDTAERLKVPLYQSGFPVYKVLGYPQKTMIGYRGTLAMINEVGNLLNSHANTT